MGYKGLMDETRFELLMKCVKDYAILMLDLDGVVVDWNMGAEHILGYKDTGILGKSFSMFFTPEDAGTGVPERELESAARMGQFADERWHVRKNGTRFWASGVTTALKDETGALRGFVKVLRDCTEQKGLHEELQSKVDALTKADQQKNEFLAMLSHELRNPLAPIFTLLHVMGHEKSSASAREQARTIIERQVQLLAVLVDELLDISRITLGKIQLNKQEVELSMIITHAIQTTKSSIEAKKLKLSVDLPPHPIWLKADVARLEQVLVNLLNNAAKYTDPGGHIQLTVAKERDMATVRLSDSGVGMTPEILPHIFDLFTQAPHSIDGAQGGMGIGLTIVKRLVEMHNGTVSAFSAGIGRGSEFMIRLPMLAGPSLAKTEDHSKHAKLKQRSLRVLIAEDNTDSAESLREVLQLEGHEVCLVNSGPKALDAAAHYYPEVAILNIGLPGLNGYEVAKRLRKYPELKNLILITITGYGQEEDKRRAKSAGFDHHLTKPVDPKKLEELLSATGKKLSGTPAGVESHNS